MFYVINVRDTRFDDKYFAYADCVDKETGDFKKCPVCGGGTSTRKWLPPIKIKLSKPKYGDFIFGAFSTFMCSQRFKKEYELAGLQGIEEFEPVEIVKVNRKKKDAPGPPLYYLASVMISTVRVDEANSYFNWESEPTCNACRADGFINGLNGFTIDESTWNNEDLFYAVGLPGTIVVSRRFYDFIKDNGFTNLTLTKTEEYSWGVF